MWKSGSIKPQSVSPKLPAPGSRSRRAYRPILGIAVLFVTVLFVFPLVFKPGVEPLTQAQFGSPFSTAVEISNQNLLPIKDVEYSCEVSRVTLANGSAMRDAKVLVRGSVRKIQGNHSITAQCQTAYTGDVPVYAIEYKLTLTYQMFPWPQHRTSVYRIASQINGNGQATGWKLMSHRSAAAPARNL